MKTYFAYNPTGIYSNDKDKQQFFYIYIRETSTCLKICVTSAQCVLSLFSWWWRTKSVSSKYFLSIVTHGSVYFLKYIKVKRQRNKSVLDWLFTSGKHSCELPGNHAAVFQISRIFTKMATRSRWCLFLKDCPVLVFFIQ